MFKNFSIVNILLSVVSVVLTLVALEVGARLYFFGELGIHGTQEPYTQASETRGFELVPGARFWMQAPDFNVAANINRHGLRGPENDLDGERERLLLVGDSGVFGSGVGDEDIFPVLLEEALGANKVDVLNGGVSTYNTVQELLFLREKGLRYEPTSVILFIYPSNDLQANTQSLEVLYKKTLKRPHAYLDSNGDLQMSFSSLSEYLNSSKGDGGRSDGWMSLYKQSVLYRMAKEVARSFTPSEFRDPNVFIGWPFLASFSPEYSTTNRDAEDYQAVWWESWIVTRKLILQIREEVEATGARFAVSVLPHKIQIEDSYQDRLLGAFPALQLDVFKITSEVRAFAEMEGIIYIDTLSPLREAAAQGKVGLFFDITDEHMTTVAHRLIVPSLARQIREQGLIQSD